MATITKEYTKDMAAPIPEEVRELETTMLRDLYSYKDDRTLDRRLEKLPKARAWRPNMMFMYFDTKAGTFVNPMEVDPAFETAPKSCRFDAELVTLHVDPLIDKMRLSAKQPLEHRLFTQAPITIGTKRDWAAWIVSSAVDVVMERDREGSDKRLQAFVEGSFPTKVLHDQEVIQVEDGRLNMSHGLWGHRKMNMFERFFGPVSKAFSSPLLSAAGIPVLMTEAFDFVNKLIQDYTKDADLKNLWQTKRLNFSIARENDQDFWLREGYWAIIETDYVQREPNLNKHKVDLRHQTFEIFNANGKPIDAPYLITRFHLEPTEA